MSREGQPQKTFNFFLSIENHISICLFFKFILKKENKHVNMVFECKQVKLATVVKGDPKAPFSIATTPRCRGGRYTFPWIAPLYTWYVPYNTEC